MTTNYSAASLVAKLVSSKTTDQTTNHTQHGILKLAKYGLTFKGRITVAKSLLLSQYTYVATILDSEDKKSRTRGYNPPVPVKGTGKFVTK